MLDEQDCMLFCDHVQVPWDRLSMVYDPAPMSRLLGAAIGGDHLNFLGWANVCRAYVCMRLLTAFGHHGGRAIGFIQFREVAAKLGEMVTYCQMWKHAIEGMEHVARPSTSGQWALGP